MVLQLACRVPLLPIDTTKQCGTTTEHNRTYLGGWIGVVGNVLFLGTIVTTVLPEDNHDPPPASIPKGEQLKVTLLEKLELLLAKIREANLPGGSDRKAPELVHEFEVIDEPHDGLFGVEEFRSQKAQSKILVVDGVVFPSCVRLWRSLLPFSASQNLFVGLLLGRRQRPELSLEFFQGSL